MEKRKPNVITDYGKLPLEIQEQLKLAYPHGFIDYIIKFTNLKGRLESALPFEAEDKKYMIRMDKEMAKLIIKLDEDFDRQGNLKEDIYQDLQEKYSDAEYFEEELLE